MACCKYEQAQVNVYQFLNVAAGPQTANVEVVIEAAQPSRGGTTVWVGLLLRLLYKHLGRNLRCREPYQA